VANLDHLGQQSLQSAKGSYLNFRTISKPDCRTRCTVEHPERQLQRKTGCFANQATSRDGTNGLLDNRLNDDRAPSPGMPRI
jgi:hypothetical protein